MLTELTQPDNVARVPLWIDGRYQAPLSGDWIEDVAPATGRVLATVAWGGATDVAAAVDAAEPAQRQWSRRSMADRVNVLLAAAEIIERNAESLALVDARDMGSPIRTMIASAKKGALYLRSIAGVAPELAGKTIPASSNGLHYTVPAAIGIVGGIAAYNHPILFACQKMAAALVAGNAVVLKPSEQAPLSTLALGELLADVLPAGLLNIVSGGVAAGAAIAEHPRIPRISFTGGVGSALALQRSVGDSGVFKQVTLELGGKNPIVVCQDAGVDEAAEAIVRGMNFTRNQGQSCGSTSRAFIHQEIRAEVTQRVIEIVSEIKLGMPELPETEMGSLVSLEHRDRVLGFVNRALDDRSRLVVGGGAPDSEALRNGAFVEPTVFDDVEPDTELAREEVFGPVLALLGWNDETDLLEAINESRFGLTASIWTRDLDRALRLASEIDAGYIWVNDVETRYPGVPFGGWKLSGVGKEQALLEEIHSFTRSKSINVAIRT